MMLPHGLFIGMQIVFPIITFQLFLFQYYLKIASTMAIYDFKFMPAHSHTEMRDIEEVMLMIDTLLACQVANMFKSHRFE